MASTALAQDVRSDRALRDRIVVQLGSDDSVEKRSALAVLGAEDKSKLPSEIKDALAKALSHESNIAKKRYWESVRGEALTPLPDPELVALLERAVAETRDPHAIPVMAESLGRGFPLIHALAEFGSPAVPDLLRVTMSPDSTVDAIDHGLIALRMIVELGGATDTVTRAGIARVAERYLTVKHRFVSTAWRALDLAAVLDDPALRAHIERFARDPDAARQMGATDAGVIAQTQRRAADLLAGTPPQPRPPVLRR